MGGGGVALYGREHSKLKLLAVSTRPRDLNFENKPEFLIAELQ